VVTIVFGFAESRPPLDSVPPHVAEKINLAALAAWSAKEIACLRAELRAVNRQFAGRKLVERAKGILQTEHGMSEQQAYELLRKMSRQRRIAMAKLAEDLVGSGGLKSPPRGEAGPTPAPR
jgi:AmiR/NasT family two-component response regulator